MRLAAAVVWVATLVACAAESSWVGHASEDSWTTPPGIPVQLRVSKFGHDRAGQVAVVTLPATTAEAPTGPAVANARIPVKIEGVACEVAVLGRTTDTVERSRSAAEEKRAPHASAGTRTLQGLTIHIGCGDQPVPGTDASLRGSHSRVWTLFGLLPLLIVVAGGELARRRKASAGGVVMAIGLLAAVILGLVMFEGTYRLSYAMLFFAPAMIMVAVMRGAQSHALRIAPAGGMVLGAAIATLIWPLWNGFGPIMALVFALVTGAIAATAVALKS